MYKRLCLRCGRVEYYYLGADQDDHRCGGCGHHCLVITITEKEWEDEVPLLRNTGHHTLTHALAGGGA